MRIGGGFWRKARMPGTRASFGRSSPMTWSAVSSRCERGFNRMKMRPELLVALGPVAPMLDM